MSPRERSMMAAAELSRLAIELSRHHHALEGENGPAGAHCALPPAPATLNVAPYLPGSPLTVPPRSSRLSWNARTESFSSTICAGVVRVAMLQKRQVAMAR